MPVTAFRVSVDLLWSQVCIYEMKVTSKVASRTDVVKRSPRLEKFVEDGHEMPDYAEHKKVPAIDRVAGPARLRTKDKIEWICRDMSARLTCIPVMPEMSDDDAERYDETSADAEAEMFGSGTAEQEDIMDAADLHSRVERCAQEQGHMPDIIMCNDIFKEVVRSRREAFERELEVSEAKEVSEDEGDHGSDYEEEKVLLATNRLHGTLYDSSACERALNQVVMQVRRNFELPPR